MPYRISDAKRTLFEYLNLNPDEITYIDDTDERGFILNYAEEECVIFVYPISHKADNTKNFFDTRDSGARERSVAWNYAIQNRLKYFCFAVHDQVPRYVNYIFSLECSERIIAEVAGTENGTRARSGTQVVIPNNYIPSKPFERILTRNGFFISAIQKDSIYEYIEKYDNRPYLLDRELIDVNITDNDEDEPTINFFTGLEFDYPRNQILFGAPGTGKSYTINQERKDLLGADNETDYERVTFHPDYSYANFVGAYKPVPFRSENGEDSITYEYVPGPFMRVYVNALKSARSDNPKPYLLIIEEINRSNVAAVFGDVFQLLDRGGDNVSEYPIQASEDIKAYLARELGGEPEQYSKIRIPDNMFIWATMNSADQGVFPMDTAFKRRWDFNYIGIDESEREIANKKVRIKKDAEEGYAKWNDIRKAINDKLADEGINEDKQLGPFFISKSIIQPEDTDEIDHDAFCNTFKNKVIMYLFEDAVKQKRSRIFGDDNDSRRYSKICERFDDIGLGIFNGDNGYIKNQIHIAHIETGEETEA